MAKMKVRTTAPAKNNKYYIHYNNGGYNYCLIIDKSTGFVLPNCTAYCQGRVQEVMEAKKVNWSIPGCNGEQWKDQAAKNGLKTGSTPKLGSVICWSQGSKSTGADGYGHVAFVEAIASDGTITVSESGYNSYLFKMEEIKPPYNRAGMKFEGFIYCPVEFDAEVTPAPAPTKPTLNEKSYPDYPAGKYYRVRPSFKDAAHSLGSYTVWANAYRRWNAYKASGYHVYDNEGNQLD